MKDYRNADQPGRYAPPEMVGADRRDVFGIVGRGADDMHLARRAAQPDDSHSDEAVYPAVREVLEEAGELGSRLRDVPGLNFVWRTRDVSNGQTRLPAAMAAGVVDRLWTFEELFDRVMGNGLAIAA